jgi:hypothetical protein
MRGEPFITWFPFIGASLRVSLSLWLILIVLAMQCFLISLDFLLVLVIALMRFSLTPVMEDISVDISQDLRARLLFCLLKS